MEDAFYEGVLEILNDGVYFVDNNRKIFFWNKGAERISGFAREEVVGKSCADNILRHVDDFGNELCIKGCPLGATMKDGNAREMEVFLHHKQGHRVPIQVRSAPIRDKQGKITGAVEIFSSITRTSQALEMIKKLQKELYRDYLTGLGNRKFADMNLSNMLHGLREHGVRFGVLFVDADHFKSVNDIYGHKVGDDVLKMIALSIAGGLRAMDVPCRWGGEEFVVFVPNATVGMLHRVGERLRMLIENSWIVHNGIRISITASFGGALSRDGDTAETIVDRADKQLYRSKEAGRNCVNVDANAG
ncbi:MAG TPA: diguanylate cyclase [Desulfonatronum sp.]|nr:diguanylate cyclase [Desulfonatronum sp.]